MLTGISFTIIILSRIDSCINVKHLFLNFSYTLKGIPMQTSNRIKSAYHISSNNQKKDITITCVLKQDYFFKLTSSVFLKPNLYQTFLDSEANRFYNLKLGLPTFLLQSQIPNPNLLCNDNQLNIASSITKKIVQ